MRFIGRKKELKQLDELKSYNKASLVVVCGRRRIGKSRLIEEFGKNYKFYSFFGFPPHDSNTADLERRAFAMQMEKYFNVPIRYNNWYDMLVYLAEFTKKENAVILLDEISWMGSKDPEFLGILKTVWDKCFKQNNKLMLVLCGSISSWIEHNILSNTGFFGRISLKLKLKELPLFDSSKFWGTNSKNISSYEKFKFLSVVGGIPRYLEELNISLNSEQNIHRLCFSSSGILFNEFEQIFDDIFSSKGHFYKKIIRFLSEGKKDKVQVAKMLGVENNGHLTEHLEILVESGFITRDFTWNLKSKKPSILSHYRLSDNYLRFYLKFIEPNRDKIQKDILHEVHLENLPAYNSVMGLQFENLILQNRLLVLEALNINQASIINEGPFFQRKTNENKGCQIDYLIQTNLDELYICEIKFSRSAIATDIIDEMKQKILAIAKPKHLSVRLVLIYIGEVSEAVKDSGFFNSMIDVKEWL